MDLSSRCCSCGEQMVISFCGPQCMENYSNRYSRGDKTEKCRNCGKDTDEGLCEPCKYQHLDEASAISFASELIKNKDMTANELAVKYDIATSEEYKKVQKTWKILAAKAEDTFK